MANSRNDAILMEILSERKTVTEFLDSVFGFLRRNTDFYYVRQNESERMGFPPGMREKIVYTMMQRNDPAQEHMQQELNHMANGEPPVPIVEQELELTTAEVHEEFDPSRSMKTAQNTNTSKQLSNGVTSAQQKESRAFSVNDFTNGACYGTYCWSQTFKDLELYVMLPLHLRRSRLLHINIDAQKIEIRNKANPSEILLEGELFANCKSNTAIWTISGDKLVINIDKTKPAWWERFFVHEPSIELNKIDTSELAEELPEESRANLEKLRYEQLEKEKVNDNAPSENQTNIALERLKAAWNADDSPFKGKEFNESNIQFG